MIQIQSNITEWAAEVAGVTKRTMNAAFAHSANATIGSTKSFIIRALTDQGAKRKNIAANLLSTKATQNNLEASISDRGRRIPLAAFSPKRYKVNTERGVRIGVTVARNGVQELVPGGFLVTMKNGKKGIFQRIGRDRLPIRQMFATQVMQMIQATQGMPESIQAFARDAFAKNFRRDFDFYKAKEQNVK